MNFEGTGVFPYWFVVTQPGQMLKLLMAVIKRKRLQTCRDHTSHDSGEKFFYRANCNSVMLVLPVLHAVQKHRRRNVTIFALGEYLGKRREQEQRINHVR